MIKFDRRSYFSISSDKTVRWTNNNLCHPTSQGLQLAIDYYANKYQCNVEIPAIKHNDYVENLDEDTFFQHLNSCIKILRKESEEMSCFRKAFILNADNTHAVPFLYIKEQGEEGLLYANSKGVVRAGWQIDAINENLDEENRMPVYGVYETRQADDHSCFMDALIFCKDATSKNNQGQYQLPHLLSDLKRRATPQSDYVAVRLPDELLKTAQITSFVKRHTENNPNKIIHQHGNKPENLTEFRNRHSDWLTKINGKIKLNSANYLRKKGLSIAEKIEIQFYINQFQIDYGKSFTSNDRNNLIQCCKAEFIRQSRSKNKDVYNTVILFQRNFERSLNRESLEMRVDQSNSDSLPNKPGKSHYFSFWKKARSNSNNEQIDKSVSNHIR
ncbi:hypothetical protein B1207_00970 [Legionella quinlivanii]|uniref:Dot/Icm T4SS effector n=1 Tax=Legionella quinlivanii TaxID=45073 RepID=A0A364LNS9_9GAMM|nr:hypothetical protein [Legionella quinlivanii]RAP38490.1 hypothetical protein B1207_00970 [Legionella quinlivanii]